MEELYFTRNVTIGNKRTSLRLERPMWDAIDEICMRENLSIHELASMVNAQRRGSSLTAAMRVFALAFFRVAATCAGHQKAGHGTLTDGDGRDSGDVAGNA